MIYTNPANWIGRQYSSNGINYYADWRIYVMFDVQQVVSHSLQGQLV